jgi:hypothetical protein
MALSSNREIIIKIADSCFLPPKLSPSSFIYSSDFFIDFLNPGGFIQRNYSPNLLPNSTNVFTDLISQLPQNSKIESLFSTIPASAVINLMRRAKKRTGYVSTNLLNFFIIKVNSQNPNAVTLLITALNKSSSVPGSGIEFVYQRGTLADIALPPLNSSSLTDQNLDDLFNKFRIDKKLDITKSPESPNIVVVDVEQGWNTDPTVMQGSGFLSPLPSIPPKYRANPLQILGGKVNKNDHDHGQMTLNILLGTPSSPPPLPDNTYPRLNGLCKGATVKMSSTWFNRVQIQQPPIIPPTIITIERREAALVATLNETMFNNLALDIGIGHIFLLELQIDKTVAQKPITSPIQNIIFKELPVEIEAAMHAVIKAAVQAGYIIIEAAGNGGATISWNDLDSTSLYTDLIDGIQYLNKLPVDLSTNSNGTGAIMVGATTTATNAVNDGKRIDYKCFGQNANTSFGLSFSSTSLASAITAALVARFQSEAMKLPAQGGIGRMLTISEIKILLNNPPSPSQTTFSDFLAVKGITPTSQRILP